MNKKEIDAPTLVLIIIIMMAIINGLTSCKSSKTVYELKNGWSQMPTKSEITGWNYTSK